MKKLSLIGLALALLIGITATPQLTGSAQGAGLISSVFNRMEKNRRELLSLQAHVLIQKVDKRFGEELSEGSVQYVPGKGRNDSLMRLDIASPRKEILAVDKGQYTLYKPKQNLAYQGKTNSVSNKGGGVLSFVFTASSAQLKNDFNHEWGGEGVLYDGGPRVMMIKLTPKNGAQFLAMEIWVDGGGMPVQTRITERNGDSTLVRLTKIQKNTDVPSDRFKLQLPSGVKIVKS